MAVPEQTPYKEYTANGSTTSFALGFICDSKNDLIVLVDGVAPPVATWSLIGANAVFTTAPASGKKIVLQRNTAMSRTANYQSNNNSFRPETINKDIDRVWWKIQELGVRDWLLDLKIQKFRDDVNLTAMEETLEQAQSLRDDTAAFAVEVEGNVVQSQTLLVNTTAKANAAASSATSANSSKDLAKQYADNIDASLTAIAGGHKAYQTLALAQADQASLPANTVVEVTNDPTSSNNGTYQWNGTTLTRSQYDPLAQANTYTDNKVKDVTTNFKTKALMTSSALPNDSYAMVTDDSVADDNGLYVKTAGAWVKSKYDVGSMSDPNINILTPDLVVSSIYIEAGTGKERGGAGFNSTTFIPVFYDETIIYEGYIPIVRGIGVAAYDKNLDYVKMLYQANIDGVLGVNSIKLKIDDPSIKYIKASDYPTENTIDFKILRKQSVITENTIKSEITNELSGVVTTTIDALAKAGIVDARAINATNGTDFSVSEYESSNYIEVQKGDIVTYKGSSTGQVGIAAYNSSKGFVKTIYSQTAKGTIASEYSFSIDDEEIAFVRASNKKADGVTFVISIKRSIDVSDLLNGNSKPEIRVFLQYATVFYVESLAENGEYLRHEFTYADNRDKDQKGWTYPRIRRNNDIIMQGNFSLIHQMLDEENWGNPLNSNDSIYIGLGHGCEETIYTKFYLDGVEFDPTIQRGYLYGNEFRMLTVSNILRPDKAKSVQQFGGVSYSTALVPHDVRSKRQAELVIRGGNEIMRDQKMHILKDNVKFTYYHAAMQTTHQEYINGTVWLNDVDGTINHFPNDFDDPQPLAPSTVRLTNGVSYGNKNCFANKFKAVGGYDGVTIEAYTDAWNVDSEENKSHHIYTWLQRSGNKVYFNPLNTLYLELAYPEYESKVFNSGDTIHTASYTKLTMT